MQEQQERSGAARERAATLADRIREELGHPARVVVCHPDGRALADSAVLAERDEAAAAIAAYAGVAQVLSSRLRAGRAGESVVSSSDATVLVTSVEELMLAVVMPPAADTGAASAAVARALARS